MEMEEDHYAILGLESGEEGPKHSASKISNAFRKMAVLVHPDKNLDDPNANANFQKLERSYRILEDQESRKLFDQRLLLRVRVNNNKYQKNSKRQKLVSDLQKREQAAFAQAKAKAAAAEEEDKIARKFKEEIASIRAMYANSSKGGGGAPLSSASNRERSDTSTGATTVDTEEKTLKVSWEKGGEKYNAERLRQLFSKFGEVEYVVIRRSKMKCYALVQMATKAAAVLASLSGNLPNLLVLPVKPATTSVGQNAFSGLSFKSFEDSVFDKLQRVSTLIHIQLFAFQDSITLYSHSGTRHHNCWT